MKHLLIFALSLVTLTSQANQPGDSITVIPFHLRGTCSLVTVPVILNGIECSFLIDSGSELSILDESQASVFNFNIVPGDEDKSTNTDWSGRPVNLSYASGATAKLGNINLKNCFRAADLDNLLATVSRRTGKNVVGIIGADVLSRYGLVIDYKNSSIHQ